MRIKPEIKEKRLEEIKNLYALITEDNDNYKEDYKEEYINYHFENEKETG